MDWLRGWVASLFDGSMRGFSKHAALMVIEFAGPPRASQVVSWPIMGFRDLAPLAWLAPHGHGGRWLLWGLTASLEGRLDDSESTVFLNPNDVFVHVAIIRNGKRASSPWNVSCRIAENDTQRLQKLSKPELNSYVIVEGGDFVSVVSSPYLHHSNAQPTRLENRWYCWSPRDILSAALAPLPEP